MSHLNVVLAVAALLLLVSRAIGLIRALLGPTLHDRRLSLQLLGPRGLALLLLVAHLL